ncbi:arginase [Dendrosporobacter sp. 1207_IL3150]|uniref:arginase n=1 Tax=Dendrosporobacter sp. 1207_IL3150 TaxID=3084054 RepID=UPI002FDAB080
MKKTISIIGAPMWLGQTRYGTNLAPDALRTAGLFDRLEAINQDVNDLGNIPITTTGHFRTNESNVKNLKAIASACDKIAQTVSSVIAEDSFPLVIGGDHSIAIGTIAGVAQHYNNLGVIWYDAHADINTPETTPSGNIHGMPLAVSMGIGHETLVSIGGNNVKVKPENIVFIGVRDIDPGEADLIADKKIKVFTAEDVDRLGMADVISQTLKHLEKCDGIHLSFDIDGIDPSSMPGVGTPVADGVSYEDSMLAIKLLEQSGCITSAEFVELNPLLDKEGKTTQASVNLIAAFLGEHSSVGLGVFARQPDVSIKI